MLRSNGMSRGRIAELIAVTPSVVFLDPFLQLLSCSGQLLGQEAFIWQREPVLRSEYRVWQSLKCVAGFIRSFLRA